MLELQIDIIVNALAALPLAAFYIFVNKSLPARLKATTRQKASRIDTTDITKIEKDIG